NFVPPTCRLNNRAGGVLASLRRVCGRDPATFCEALGVTSPPVVFPHASSHSCANWTTTLMSSGCRRTALMTSSGGTRRVTRHSSHARSARARTCPALYQWRLFAFTLPTTTLLRSTIQDATSAVVRPTVRPPLPTPVRHTTPPGAIAWIESAMTSPAPVHSTITSGWKPTPATVPVWYVAPNERTSRGLGPDS